MLNLDPRNLIKEIKENRDGSNSIFDPIPEEKVKRLREKRFLRAEVDIPGITERNIQPRNNEVKELEKLAGIKYPHHFVWVNSNNSGRIIFPRTYKRVYKVTNQGITFLNTNRSSKDYYEIKEGKTIVHLSSFSGVGTEADPHQISTEQQLRDIGTGSFELDDYYIQMNDINLIDPFPPIGGTGAAVNIEQFLGQYDGDNFTIHDLDIDINHSHMGFIRENSGDLINTNFRNSFVSGHFKVGTLAGNNFGLIDNCTVKGEVQTTSTEASLTVGRNEGEMYNILSQGDLFPEKTDTSEFDSGGLVANNSGIVENSFCNVNNVITGNILRNGGFVGINQVNGHIKNCFCFGRLEGTVATSRHAGFAGSVIGNSIIENCYTLALPINHQSGVNGFVGQILDNAQIINCYWDPNIVPTSVGGEPKTRDELLLAAYTNWDFKDVWFN